MARLPILLAAAAGLVAMAVYVGVAVSRLGYPYALEWLEGNSLVEVERLLTGRPLYSAPTVDYVPDAYPPLYFATSAALASVLGVSYLPLRLVSLVASLGCFVLLTRLVQRETGDLAAGVAAAGLYAATYFAVDSWLDFARVDSLFLLLSLAGLYLARWMRRPGGAVAAGLLLAAAFLTKQSALAEAVAITAALLCGPRRRLGGWLAVTFAAVMGLTTLVWGLSSHGWYVFYVFELLAQHRLHHAAFTEFWTRYLLPALGFALGAVLLAVRRTPLLIGLGCLALVVEGYAGLVHAGGAVNNMLPVYVAVALLAGIGMGGSTPSPRGAVAGLLVLAQIAVLAVSTLDADRVVPGPADRRVGDRLRTWLGEFDGPVAVFSDPGLNVVAGLPPVAHRAAAADILRGTDRSAQAELERSIARAVTERRFAAIVVGRPTDLRGFPPDLKRYYRRCPEKLLADVPKGVFRPIVGGSPPPSVLWLPLGRGSCAEITRRLG
ncbi:glycosyltransferase family 39 protein [Nonomuraea sp. NPDC049269]|uniref:glycosyltransferase family 39 protein n=1 Tax=Nonomuraea sp. NPDC049269 TaxID=3364349 RepID=UPI00371C6332